MRYAPPRFLFILRRSLVWFLISATAAAESVPVEVHGRIEKCSITDGATLDFSFKNLSDRTIDISTDGLPWGLTSSIFLLAITKTSTPVLLDPIRYFDDPRVGSTVLKPSEVARGQIDLKRRFPDFLAKLKKGDLVVVWAYQGELSDGETTSAVTGSILVERRSCVL